MVKENQAPRADNSDEVKAGQLEIIYYTDPLCCWSWAIEPQLRKLQFEYNGRITLTYRMGGLLPGWQNYHDEVNSVSRPIQMGPVWMHAQQISGMPMDSTIWMRDPPASSYPACIAVKSAALQCNNAGVRYLRLLREAVMLNGQNIAKEYVLTELAEKLHTEDRFNFDITKFREDLNNDNGLEAFRKDLQETQNRQLTRFPTMIIRNPANEGIILTGYRPYKVLSDALKHMAPELEKSNDLIDGEQYEKFWGGITKREADEIKNKP